MFYVEVNTTELKRHRRAKGWTQVRLDKEAGLREGRTTQFERRIVRPTPEELMALAVALDIPSNLLVTKGSKQELLAAIGVVGQLLRIRVKLDPENDLHTVIS